MNYLPNYFKQSDDKHFLVVIFLFLNLISDILPLAFFKHFNLVMQHFMLISHQHYTAINKIPLNNSYK